MKFEHVTGYYDDADGNECSVSLLVFECDDTIIYNPYISDCGRFEVTNPCEYYKLTQEELDEVNRCNSKYFDLPIYL